MTSSRTYIRQHILDLPPYKPIYPLDVLSEELGIPIHDLVKLDANENPFGPLPEVKEALSRLDTLHIYPDPESRQIRRHLATHHKINEERIVVGAGADELIDLIMRIVIDPGDRILNCPPTFGMYSFDGELNQAQVISVPRNPDFSLDMERLIAAAESHNPKLLFLANPNNPNGGVISQDEFLALIDLPLLLVLDEAYIQFSEHGQSFISQTADYPNLIVLRTFSKWAGLAGLRIGYGVFPADLTPILMKAKQPYNVSATAEMAAVVTMQNIAKSEERISEIIQQRDRLFDQLASIPWLKPYPTQANFILCQVLDRSALEIKNRLRQQGILIRHFNTPELSDHIRISVGTEQQNLKLLRTLKEQGEL